MREQLSYQNICWGWSVCQWKPWRIWRCQTARTSASSHGRRTLVVNGRWTSSLHQALKRAEKEIRTRHVVLSGTGIDWIKLKQSLTQKVQLVLICGVEVKREDTHLLSVCRQVNWPQPAAAVLSSAHWTHSGTKLKNIRFPNSVQIGTGSDFGYKCTF